MTLFINYSDKLFAVRNSFFVSEMFLNLLIISAKKPRAKEKVKDSQTDQTAKIHKIMYGVISVLRSSARLASRRRA